MGKMDKNVDFLASDIPLVEKNWWPPDFNNLIILCLPLLKNGGQLLVPILCEMPQSVKMQSVAGMTASVDMDLTISMASYHECRMRMYHEDVLLDQDWTT